MLDFIEALNMNSEDVAPVLMFSLFIVGFFAYKISGRLFEAMEADAARTGASQSQSEVQAAVREATAPLQDRVNGLEAEVRTLRQRLEAREDPEDSQPPQAESPSENVPEGGLPSKPDWDDTTEDTTSRSRGSSVRA